nr:MAG: RNA-dependent RNA polymerase [Guiyang Paspalum thunbergii mito-like virus 1]
MERGRTHLRSITVNKHYISIEQLLPLKAILSKETNATKAIPLIGKSVDQFDNLARTRGVEFAVTFFKRSRLHVTRYLCGSPLLERGGVGLYASGLPKWLGLQTLNDFNHSDVRVLLTLLTIGRLVNTKPRLDTSTITEEWAGALPGLTGRELRHIAKVLGIKKWNWEWSKFHYSTKSGPNGQALASSKADLIALPQDLIDDLILCGGRYVRDAVEGLTMKSNYFIDLWYKVFPGKSKNRFRKLAYFADREGKTRVVAILDYWSQTVLKPLHDRVNSILRGIKSDCTFDQGSFQNCLPSTGPYHSLDLTAATDRMPLSLQKVVLSLIVGEEKAEAWGRILTKWEYASEAGPVLYKTGQPMGAYSSWPVMALTHHFLVRLSALRCGLPHFTHYAILGDDVVIANDKVADKYREILSTLAMPISSGKTHVSQDTFEFAKRWIQKGVEVTPLSLSGLVETWNRYYLFSNFIQNQQLHGWFTESGDPESILEIMMKSRGKVRQVPSIVRLYQIFTSVQDLLRSRSELAANRVIDLLAIPVPENYPRVDFIVDLVANILRQQCVKEELKLLGSKADFHIKIREGLKAHLPDLRWLSAVRRHYAEFSPVLGAISILQYENTHTLVKLKTGSPQEVLDIVMSKDLVGTSINMNLFSMRAAKSRIVSQAIIVKQLRQEVIDYYKEDNFL